MARVLASGGGLVIGELGRFSAWAAWRHLRGWLGVRRWRAVTFHSAAELCGLAENAGLVVLSVHGAAYYPPIAPLARLCAPLEPGLSSITSLGAAFLALAARRPAMEGFRHG